MVSTAEKFKSLKSVYYIYDSIEKISLLYPNSYNLKKHPKEAK